jgi:hypothetical protein
MITSYQYYTLHLTQIDTMASPTKDDDLRNSVSSMITGVEDGATSSGSSGTPYDDDLTPFPSPVLSATSLAGLSRE